MASTLLAAAGEAMQDWADHVDHNMGALRCWQLGSAVDRPVELVGVEAGPTWRPAMTKVEDVRVSAKERALAKVEDVRVRPGASAERLQDAIRRAPRPRASLPTGRPPLEQAAVGSVPSSASEAPAPRARDEGLQAALARLRAVEEAHRGSWSKFSDADFRERFFKLDGKHEVAFWGRPKDISRHDDRPLIDHESWWWLLGAQEPEADWRLFRDRPRAIDVQQGELGDCWFLSSLGALADYEDGRFVRALLPEQVGISDAGAYLVRLCMGGRWLNIMVDDRLPCIGGGRFYVQLACCVTHRLQIWASVIEKAFAKACGCYERIVGGEAGEALSVLTGWPCTMIRFCRRDFEVDTFWAQLCSSRDAGFLMTCSTCDTRSSPLEPFHVFLLMDVFEVPRAGGGSVRLVKIRNQQEKEKSKWTGTWSDACSNWTSELREQLGCPVGGIPGVFFMALGDFLRQFAHCTICRIRSGDDWHQERRPVELPTAGPAMAGLRLSTSALAAESSLSLSQPEERARGGPLFPGLPQEEAAVGFVLLKQGAQDGSPASSSSGSKPPSVEAVATMRCAPSVSADCWLDASSSYSLVPLSLPCAGPTVPAALAVFSSQRLGIEETRLSLVEVRAAWAAYARATCERSEAFRGAALYMGKAEGGAVVALAENRSQGHFCVELSLASSNLHFARGASVTVDWLPPGYAQVVQVAVPALGSGGSAGWRSQHKFQMTSRNPNKARHSPPMVVPDGLHTPFRLSDGLPLLGLSSL